MSVNIMTLNAVSCYSMLLEFFKLPQLSKGCLPVIHVEQGLATTEFSCE